LQDRSERQRLDTSRFPSITTSITTLTERDHLYRGMPVKELLRVSRFEGVAELLWQAEPGPWEPTRIVLDRGLPPDAAIGLTVARLVPGDPSVADQQPEVVAAFARTLIATVAAAQCRLANPRRSTDRGAISVSLAEAFTSDPGRARSLRRLLDAMLITLADHELSPPSTLVVRIAASERSGLASAIASGLGVLNGHLHNSIDVAFGLLEASGEIGADRALSRQLETTPNLMIFGHQRGPQVRDDPRFDQLMLYFNELATAEHKARLDSLLDAARRQKLPPANLRLAIAAVTWAAGTPYWAGSVIYRIARMAGWTAHYLEEQTSTPRRFRVDPAYAQRTTDVHAS
jgi:citrate synthase